jgi:hypothetical protein
MVQDLLTMMKILEEKMRNYPGPLMGYLRPSFKLIGSVVEGTRVGLGNEIDLTVTMQGLTELKRAPFEVVDKDPFHITATAHVPHWMKVYIDEQNKFLYGQFMSDFLVSVNACLAEIFRENKNPRSLTRGTTNNEWESDKLKCKECKKNKQCENCVLTVSQTKMGVCLQLFWQSKDGIKIYCSVDLVPTFPIIKVKALDLARIVNIEMVKQQPPGWLRYLEKYSTSDVILTDLFDVEDESSEIGSVLLKQLSGQQYFVRPGQYLGTEKFSSDDHRKVYCWIKALKTILKVDMSSYMVKKMLLCSPEAKPGSVYDFLFSTMCQPELKERFESKIDYGQWEKKEDKLVIPLMKRVK